MSDTPSEGLWEGDLGTLSLEARDLLVVLVRDAFIKADDTERWRLVCDDGVRPLIERDLADLGLILHVNSHAGVAWAEEAGVSGVSLIKRAQPLNGPQTWVLCQLMRDQAVFEANGNEGFCEVPIEDLVDEGRAKGGPWEGVLTEEDGARCVRRAIKVLCEQGYAEGGEDGPWHVSELARATITLDRAKDILAQYSEAVAAAEQSDTGEEAQLDAE